MSENRGGPEQSAADVESRLADDRFYRALASTQRRRVLHLLLDGGERSVEELATMLVGWDATADGQMADADDRKRRRIELLHRDLPALEAARLVRHDREAGAVAPAALGEELADLLARSVEGPPEP